MFARTSKNRLLEGRRLNWKMWPSTYLLNHQFRTTILRPFLTWTYQFSSVPLLEKGRKSLYRRLLGSRRFFKRSWTSWEYTRVSRTVLESNLRRARFSEKFRPRGGLTDRAPNASSLSLPWNSTSYTSTLFQPLNWHWYPEKPRCLDCLSSCKRLMTWFIANWKRSRSEGELRFKSWSGQS